MKSEDELYIAIEKYIHQKMDTTEAQEFEKQLAESPEVAQKVQLQRLAKELILKNRLAQLADYSKELQQKEIKHQQYAKIAKIGACLLLAGLSAYFFIKPTEHSLPTPHKHDDSITRSPKDKVAVSTATSKPQGIQKSSQKTAAKPAQEVIFPNTREVNRPIEAPLPIHEHAGKPIEDKVPHVEPIIEKPTAPNKESHGPCHQVTLEAHIQTFKTCVGESEGAISVSQVQGGHKPYSFKVLSLVDHQEKGLSGLEAGKYSVSITDSKNCSQVFENIVVGSKACNIDHQFNPALGEVWEAPSSSTPAELYIRDPSGHLVFQKHIGALDKISWDGKSLDGHLQFGIFVYLLKYADGTQQQGNITVLQ